MIRNRIILKSFAVFFALEILSSTIIPSASFALTSGPNAPEATSFEPIDTTDLVNVATGDLAYNFPLIEVPGPSGGYPLSLSYHAGIQPNEEASWVGLGWTLNPGAITRTVNGYADDQLGASRTRTDHNSGAERSTFSVGVGYPGMSMGVSVSHDSNLGTSVGFSATVGYAIGDYAKASLTVGTDGYGNSSAVASVGVGVQGANGVSYGLGISTNFETVSVSPSIGMGPLDVSMDSKGLKPSVSVAGASMNQVNSKAAAWDTESFSFMVPIPLGNSGLFLNLGYSYYRYYMHETSDVKVIGSLYAGQTSGKNRDDWAFDSYALIDPVAVQKSIKNNDPEKSQGGSLPAYDSYNVNAQGLTGSIQPYIFGNGTLFRQNLKDSENRHYLIEYKQSGAGSFTQPGNFRFKNDFSNTHAVDDGEMMLTHYFASQPNYNYVTSSYTVEKSPPAKGYNYTTKQLAGSRHIDWFSNANVQNGTAKTAGFVDYQPPSQRTLTAHGSDVSSQIGGFMITNESGMTYHYALPVYAYGEFSKSFKTGKPNDIYQTNANNNAYAYTWMLTAVTGPDFVDRNGDGMANGDDWGYWVTFKYGMWADNYLWRNPAINTHTDLDPEIEYYSLGKKEIYYLDAIATKSHTALFEKELRADSRSVVETYNLRTSTTAKFGLHYFPAWTDVDFDGYEINYPAQYHYSTATLKLSNIYLIENSALNAISAVADLTKKGTTYDHNYNFTNGENSYDVRVHQGMNVLDKFDLNAIRSGSETYRAAIKKNSIRVLTLNHDYALQDGPGDAGVPNSFDPNGNIYTKTPSESHVTTKLGKLTLQSITFGGKTGTTGLIPPMQFSYGKNPIYNKDATDMWGLYKSDYKDGTNPRLKRAVTSRSALDVDAWCLSKIVTSTGTAMNIEYESDTYNQAVLAKQIIFNLKKVENVSANRLKFTFHESDYDTELDFRDYFAVNQLLEDFIVMYHKRSNGQLWLGDDVQCESAQNAWLRQAFEYSSKSSRVKEVGQNYLIVEDAVLYTQLTGAKREPAWDEDEEKHIFATCDGQENAYTDGNYRFTGYPDGTLGGCVSISNDGNISAFGGGIRVKEISHTNLFGTKRSTSYTYENGTTSYEPFGIMEPILDESSIKNVEWLDAHEKYGTYLNNKFSYLLNISREVPAPGVIYERVTVTDNILHPGDAAPIQVPTKKTFEFQTFDERMIERKPFTRTQEVAATCKTINGVPVDCNVPRTGDPTKDPYSCLDANGKPVTCPDGNDRHRYTPIVLNDFSSWIGALKGITTYGPNGVVLEKTENQYLHDLENIAKFKTDLRDKYGSQGKISQTFTEWREIRNPNGTHRDLPVFVIKHEYPLVALGQSSTSYKTGVTTSATNLAFDFYTGRPTKILLADSYGNTFINESVPAYTVDAYSGMTSQQITDRMPGMGLKVNNPKNRNMLVQDAASYLYQVDPANNNNPTGLLSASAQTWSDQVKVFGLSSGDRQAGVWRKHSSYQWKGDDVALNGNGLYPFTNFVAFNFATPGSSSGQWEKLNEVSLYDIQSHVLEAIDINNNLSATRFSTDHKFVIATGVNTSFDELQYTGCEDKLPGFPVHYGKFQLADGTEATSTGTDAVRDLTTTHTGKKAAKLTLAAKKTLTYTFTAKAGKTYRASVWMNNAAGRLSYSVNGQTPVLTAPVEAHKAGTWYLVTVDFVGSASSDQPVTIWCETIGAACTFDDIRVHPFDAAVITYVYNPWGELSHVLDNNNLYTEYRYDAMGRLTDTYKETFAYEVKRMANVQYHYKGQ